MLTSLFFSLGLVACGNDEAEKPEEQTQTELTPEPEQATEEPTEREKEPTVKNPVEPASPSKESTSGEDADNAADVEIELGDYSEDQKTAPRTMSDLESGITVSMGFNEYSSYLMNQKVKIAEYFSMQNGLYMDALIAKDGFLGVVYNSDDIKEIQKFSSLDEAKTYAKNK